MKTKKHVRQHIVIAGAGFAGLAAALELERLKNVTGYEYNVTLVDRNCYHLYHALLYEVATAEAMVKAAEVEALRRGVCIRIKALDDILLKKNIAVVQDEVTGFDVSRQEVALAHQPPLHFDQLVVALGSVSNDFGIPGLGKHSVALKELSDALNMNMKLQAILKRARSGQSVRILVGGGGVSGVETAGELAHYLKRLERQKQFSPGACRVALVEAGPTILAGLGDWAQRVSLRRLAQLGVEVLTGQPITAVEASRLRLKNGRTEPFDILLWSGGIRAHPLLEGLGAPTAGKKQACVLPTLQLPNLDNVFVAGDGAYIVDAHTGRPVPQTAPEAVAQGRQVATNIFRSISRRPLHAYNPRQGGFVFPVGGRWAVSTMWGFRLSGWAGWLVRKYVDLEYFMSILTTRNAVNVFWTGGRIYLRNG